MKKNKMKGNKYGKRNQGKSHAPVFRATKRRPLIDGEFNRSNLKALAAQILLNVHESIRTKRNNLHEATSWRRDLYWLHNDDSNYNLWCEILGIDKKHLRKMHPKSIHLNQRRKK